MVMVSAMSRFSRYLLILVITMLVSLISVALIGSPIVYGINNNTMVIADTEVGGNDFQISDMGLDGDVTSDAGAPAVAYNSVNHEYMVVWSGNDQSDTPNEIYGQRINAATGQELGDNDFVISQMSTNVKPTYAAFSPDIVYNPISGEYLVVWLGQDQANEGEESLPGIFAQRLDATTGEAIGTDDFQIDSPVTDQSAYFAFTPTVAHNSTTNEYLVLWEGNPTGEELTEVMGQRLSATGVSIGENILAISGMVPNEIDVAYHADANEYLAVWAGNEEDQGTEIFVRRLSATGEKIGENGIRISNMNTNPNFSFNASSPVVAYNSVVQEYLIAWTGGFDDDAGVNYEIYVQRLGATAQELGEDDQLISQTASDTNWYITNDPAVVYNPIDDEYLVTWAVDNILEVMDSDEFEIYGQRLDGTTIAEVGTDDFRISDMGPDGDDNYQPFTPVIAHNSQDNAYLVVWSGDDNTDPLVDGEFEIFGQRLAGQQTPTPTATPTPTTTLTPTATITPTPTAIPPTATPTPDLPPIEGLRIFLPLTIR